jgi:hypothetical protein
MAGSIKWFIYSADDGTDFALLRDESNLEAVNGGAQDYPNTGSSIIYAIPRNLTPRYLRFVSDDGLIARNIVALTPTIFANYNPSTTITDQTSGDTLRLKIKRGESVTIPIGPDTGLQDGDAT